MTNSIEDRLFTAAEGILGLRVPMPPPLEWINCYFLRDDDGWFVVDTGYNTAISRAVMQEMVTHHLDGLPVKGVIVTHYHPDHSGQAGWLCKTFNCPLYMSRTEFFLARWLSIDTTDSYLKTIGDYYRNAEAPQEVIDILLERGNNFLRVCDEMPAHYTRLIEGQKLTIGGREWQVMIGRGHAPEMIMLYDAAGKLFISADQVVARITPNVSIWPFATSANPLKEFLATSEYLPKVVPNDVTILPGHGRPFDNFHERISGYIPFHDARLNKLRGALTDAPQSLHQMMKVMFVRDLSPRDFVFALGEAHSHMNYLIGAGEAVQLPGVKFLYKKL